MTTFLKIATTALVLTATFAPAAKSQEFVTGIGFGNTRTEAMTNAVRAWIGQAINDYGDGNWNMAFRGPMQCNQTQSGGATTMGIGTVGDYNASWACSVSGLPAAAQNG